MQTLSCETKINGKAKGSPKMIEVRGKLLRLHEGDDSSILKIDMSHLV